MKVYQAISKVASILTKEGIGKGRKNAMQGYNFRGIDDVLNALSSALVEAGLVILPRVTNRDVVERTTAKGGAIFYVTVHCAFDLVSIEDGSKHTVVTYGEAMDSADKATNKAMSAAYKYLALLTFCIPTEASTETDADFTTHEIRAKQLISDKRTAELEELALYMIDCHNTGKEMDAIKLWYDPKTFSNEGENDANEERKFVWSLMKVESKLRATLKANNPNKPESDHVQDR